MRGWVEQAKKAGQALGQPSPAPGTYAAGASLVTELLGSFMNEMINTAPAEHKVRIDTKDDKVDLASPPPYCVDCLEVVPFSQVYLASRSQKDSTVYCLLCNAQLTNFLAIRPESSNLLIFGIEEKLSLAKSSQSIDSAWQLPLQTVGSIRVLPQYCLEKKNTKNKILNNDFTIAILTFSNTSDQ